MLPKLIIVIFTGLLVWKTEEWIREYASEPYWIKKTYSELERSNDREGILNKIEYGIKHSAKPSLKGLHPDPSSREK